MEAVSHPKLIPSNLGARIGPKMLQSNIVKHTLLN